MLYQLEIGVPKSPVMANGGQVMGVSEISLHFEKVQWSGEGSLPDRLAEPVAANTFKPDP